MTCSPGLRPFTEGFDTADLQEAKAVLDERGITRTNTTRR
jgi:hypothetical protein